LGTFRLRRINLRLLIALAIIAILATAAYGFAASNTVGASRAGDGSGAISGYRVTDVAYTLDSSNPTLIAGVSFTTNAVATNVKAQLTAAGAWYPCTTSNGTSWTCTAATSADETAVLSADNLRVVATQ
jgi:hypothetical protein